MQILKYFLSLRHRRSQRSANWIPINNKLTNLRSLLQKSNAVTICLSRELFPKVVKNPWNDFNEFICY